MSSTRSISAASSDTASQPQDVLTASVASTLAALAGSGFGVYVGLRRPGCSFAPTGMVVVGPTGVFLVETRSWSAVTVDDDRVFGDGDDVTNCFGRLADLAYSIEAALADIGLAPGELHPVIVTETGETLDRVVSSVSVLDPTTVVRHIVARGTRLTAAQVAAASSVISEFFPDAVLSGSARFGVDYQLLSSALREGASVPPVAPWMTQLDPALARVVRRSFDGPVCIVGPAGTGKSIVGLHRAAYLARSRDGRVLVATMTRSLPRVLAELMTRLAPDVADRIDFLSVDEVAAMVLRDRGAAQVDVARADHVFGEVWREHGAPGPLREIDADPHYWRDEIRRVIKGRAIAEIEQYLTLERLGRDRDLDDAARRSVWALYAAYENGLRVRGICDAEDRVISADALLRDEPVLTYDAVIVDECQDASTVGLRMLAQLVASERDGLTLLGDRSQSTLAGSYELADAGISTADRIVALPANLRSTREIVALAQRVQPEPRHRELPLERSGGEPVIAAFRTAGTSHDVALVARLAALRELGVVPGQIAVLGIDPFAVLMTISALEQAGVPWVGLEAWDGVASAGVVVGTTHQAKGLDFAQVLLARVSAELLEADDAGCETAACERRRMQRRELYVGITRARDGLWLGTVA